MIQRFLCCGESECVKAGFHTTLGVLLAGAFIYNLAAFLYRRDKDKRLLTNTIIYGAGIGLEVVQTLRHVQVVREQRI